MLKPLNATEGKGAVPCVIVCLFVCVRALHVYQIFINYETRSIY